MKSEYRFKFRTLRFLLFGAIVLATVVALVLSAISYGSRREWTKTKANLIARGEKLSLAELAPPPIPDEFNFYADPLWLELADGKLRNGERGLDILDEIPSQDDLRNLRSKIPGLGMPSDPTRKNIARAISYKDGASPPSRDLAAVGLAWTEPLEPLSRKIIELLNRPSARFPIRYENGFGAEMPHLKFVSSLADLFNTRARLELGLGNPSGASEDIIHALRLARTLDSEPMLISQLISAGVVMRASSVIENGIAAHSWTDADLRAFERALSARPPVATLITAALRGERAGCNSAIEAVAKTGDLSAVLSPFPVIPGADSAPEESEKRWARMLTRYYLSRDQAHFNNLVQSYIDEVAASRNGVSPGAVKKLGNETRSDAEKFWHPLSTLNFPPIFSGMVRLLKVEETLRLVTVACALERFRMAQNTYPASLGALVPLYLEEIPHGVLEGQSIEYRESEGRFVLWTAGWDEIDEGGRPPATSDSQSGDWIFNPWGKVR